MVAENVEVSAEASSTHKLRSSFVAQGVLVAVGIYVVIDSFSLGLSTSLGPGPGMFPFALGVLLIALSVIWLLQDLRAPEAVTQVPDDGQVWSVFVSLVLLGFALDLLGYQLSMFAFLLFHIKFRGQRSWPLSLLLSAAGSFGTYYGFVYGISVFLPTSAIPLLNGIGL